MKDPFDVPAGLARAPRAADENSSLRGSHHDDTLIHDPGYKHINGGPGLDTLVVPPSTTLNLASHIFGIEIFDLDGGNSTIILNAQQVMRLTSTPHTLQITGAATDAVYAEDGWSYFGTSGSSALYKNEEATLVVDTESGAVVIARRSGIVDHSPDAEADKRLSLSEDSAATPLAISAPAELDGDPLIVTVLGVPNAAIGSIFLGAADGGTAVVQGQALTIAQLDWLVFSAVPNASGAAGAFSYAVADQGTALGLSDTQTITIDVLPSPTGSRVLDNVPAYSWYHGCGPTAAASVFGYWDVHGYSDYFDASGWDEVRYTINVQDEISSPAHNAKYDPTPDNPSLPDPPKTSIADFFHTSENPSSYGWTFLSYIEPGMESYAALRGQPLDAWTVTVDTTTWHMFVDEIDAGHPSVFLVDTNGDRITDHFVPVLGYDDRGAEGLWYGAYTTWSESETVSWFPFQSMGSGRSWGIGYVTFVDEPSDLAQRAGTLADVDSAAGGYMDLNLEPLVGLIGNDADLAIAREC